MRLGDPFNLCEQPILSLENNTEDNGNDFITIDENRVTVEPTRPRHLGLH